MAPFLKPQSLFDICLKEVTEQINCTCLKIARKHRYSFENSEYELSQISLFLRENVPAKLINRVYNNWIESDISCHPCFGTVILVNAYTEILHVIPGKESCPLYVSVGFWRSLLIRVENIVELDFSLICTDELLEVVGKHCVSLVKLNAESSVTKYTDEFGHLAVKLNVTDKGLEYICYCTKLKVLQIDNWHDSTQLSDSVTINGIRMLLKKLPNLRNINFLRMGEALSSDMSDITKLTLRQVHDYAPSQIHMRSIKFLCPDLTSLILYFVNAGPEENEMNEVLNEITESSLSLKEFTIKNCLTNQTFCNFLRVKGNMLTTLKLDAFNSITHSLIHFIGLHCPNLKVISLNEIRETIMPVEVDLENKELYSNLKLLNVTGSWNARLILPELLNYCHRLEYLHIECKFNDFTGIVDKVINDILKKNPLKSLSFLHASCYLKFSTLQMFAALPKMKELHFVKKIGYVTQNDIEVLYSDFKDFDIDLIYFDRD